MAAGGQQQGSLPVRFVVQENEIGAVILHLEDRKANNFS